MLASQETLARLVGCWLWHAGAFSSHTHSHTLSYTALQLQVCILVCAAKALWGSLETRYLGCRDVCRRHFLLMRRVCVGWIWGWWRRRRTRVRGERVRVRDLLDGHGFSHALFLALPLLILLQLLWRLRLLDHDSGVLLQVLAPRGLGQHDKASAVHSRRRPEIQLSAVLPPAFELGVVLSLYVSRCDWDFQNLRKEKKSQRQVTDDLRVHDQKKQEQPLLGSHLFSFEPFGRGKKMNFVSKCQRVLSCCGCTDTLRQDKATYKREYC